MQTRKLVIPISLLVLLTASFFAGFMKGKTGTGPLGSPTVVLKNCHPLPPGAILANGNDEVIWQNADPWDYRIVFPNSGSLKQDYSNPNPHTPFVDNGTRIDSFTVPANKQKKSGTATLQDSDFGSAKYLYFAYSIYQGTSTTPCNDPGLHVLK